MNRAERLVTMIQAIRSGQRCSVVELAELAGVHRRTILRDIGHLRDGGVPLAYERRTGRYAIDDAIVLPPAMLDEDEALALLMALKLAIHENVIPDAEALEAATIKITGMLPGDVRERCRALVESVDIRTSSIADSSFLRGFLRTIQQAVADRRKLQAEYAPGPNRKKTTIILQPYRVVSFERRWHLVGLCDALAEVRTHRVDSFTRVVILEETYTIPSGFDLDEYLGHAWRLTRGEKRYHVKIRFHPEAAPDVDGIVWHKSQTMRRERNGALLFETYVDGLEEISRWIFGFGEHAQVLSPPALRDVIARRAASMCAYCNGQAGRNG